MPVTIEQAIIWLIVALAGLVVLVGVAQVIDAIRREK